MADADGRVPLWTPRPSAFVVPDLCDDEKADPSMPLSTLPVTPAMKAGAADETGLRAEIIRAIRHAADNAPRSLQRTVGPSQVGTPCARQLAYAVAGTDPAPGRETMHDPWPSVVGTAVHAWLADAMEIANLEAIRRGEAPPWIVETRVDVGLGLRGSSDLFHIPTGCVIDWKALGDTQYRKLSTQGPGDRYRKQAHCYGLGFVRAGYKVNRVAIALVGRAKRLSDLHIWSEPYDQQVALSALKRLQIVGRLMESGVSPQNIPATAGGECYFCAWAGDPGQGYCSGTKDGV